MNRPARTFKATRNSKVAVWNNGDKGLTITIQPPQYKDANGNWKTSSFWVQDLPAIMHAIGRALAWADGQEAREMRDWEGGSEEEKPNPSPQEHVSDVPF